MSEPAKLSGLCDDSCCGGDPSLELLRELGRFSAAWRWDALVEPPPDGRPLTRADLDRQLAARVRADPELASQLRDNPRWVYMAAMWDAYRTPRLGFLGRIREVRLLEEGPGLRYLVLPHAVALQLALEGRDSSEEQLSSLAAANGDGAGDDARDAFERALVLRADRDPALRDGLLFDPDATYRREAAASFAGVAPAFLAGVREIRVIPETASSLVFVLRA